MIVKNLCLSLFLVLMLNTVQLCKVFRCLEFFDFLNLEKTIFCVLCLFSYSYSVSDGSEESTAGHVESPCSIMMYHGLCKFVQSPCRVLLRGVPNA